MQLERPRWRPKTRAVNKVRLKMKIILYPKLEKEKITIIQDSSSDENKKSEESLKPQQDYIQEYHPISPEPVQEGHEILEEKDTPIMEQGISSRVSFLEEAMKNKQEEDLFLRSWIFHGY